MEVIGKQLRRVDLIQVRGRVDSATAPQLEEALRAIMAAGRFRFVVDMQAVEYLSSAGLRVLVGALKQARRWNRGDLYLANVPERTMNVMRLAGVDVLFRIFASTVDAVGSF